MKKWRAATAVVALVFVLAGCGEEKTETQEQKTVAQSTEKEETHAHSHAHDEKSEAAQKIYEGYFEDGDVQERPLTNWANNWQSVYPYLQDGTLDEVFEHKAEGGDKTATAYKKYYKVGYKTDVTAIDITANTMTFYKGKEKVTGTYEADGYEILTYEKGNRGVRYIFKQVDDASTAPKYVQFSDHIIHDEKSSHFHLYFGDDRAKLLEEMDNWPTYYPADLSGHAIAHEMIAH